jgi:hypothetical protein
MSYTIKTNNQARPTLQFFQLDAKEQQTVKDQFSYLTQDELEEQSFFKYRGEWYSLSDFLRLDKDTAFEGWDGVHSYSYFSGLLIKVLNCFGEYDVVVARFCC